MRLYVSRENSLKSKGLIIVGFSFFMKGKNNLALSRMEKYLAIIKVLDDWDSINNSQSGPRISLVK